MPAADDETPCPSRTTTRSTQLLRDELSFDITPDDHDNDDAEDFTRAFPQTEYKLSKPRERKGAALKQPPVRGLPPRRSGVEGEGGKKAAMVKEEEEVRKQATGAAAAARKGYVEEEAKKAAEEEARRKAAAAEAEEREREKERRPGLSQAPRRMGGYKAEAAPARRRISQIMKDYKESKQAQQEQAEQEEVKRKEEEARRIQQQLQEQQQRPSFEFHTVQPVQQPLPPPPPPRRSLEKESKISAPPKRIRPSGAVQRQSLAKLDASKASISGKENVPPGARKSETMAASKKRASSPKAHEARPRRQPEPTNLGKPRPPVQQPRTSGTRPSLERAAKGRNKRPSEYLSDDEGDSIASDMTSHSDTRRGDSLRLIKRPKRSMEDLPSPPGFTAEEEEDLRPPADFLAPGLISRNNNYQPSRPAARKLDPVLAENIERSEMYEESWLAAQESSVTQLLNHLLASYSPAPTGKPRLELRREFLKMYCAAPFPLVHDRVDASLSFGTLSITQNTIDKASTSRGRTGAGWGSDLGLKTRFMELFVGSYDQTALVTALEVVVGREMFAIKREESERKTLETFLERYVVNSEDLLAAGVVEQEKGRKLGGREKGKAREDEEKGNPAWLLRKTLLRALMVVFLLDKAKANDVIGRQNLFKTSSPYKSSSSIVTALFRMLHPSTGDTLKSLRNLSYTLEITQTPYSEFSYPVTNLATDLRDGIRLARVVEVLLHSQRPSLSDPDPTASLDGGDEESWVLTPHLHFPTNFQTQISRPQKVHNVKVILDALADAGGNPNNVTAEDIVDGHREITVGLLWNLLSTWGLDLMVDWEVVRSEISTLARQAEERGRPSRAPKRPAGTMAMSLLETWARLVAEKHGLRVQNLTTSFADGKVFAAIVDEYEQYLPSRMKLDRNATLEMKLKAMGCNSYFSSLFSPSSLTISNGGQIFSTKFTISALSYLCSRLLSPSIPERAAMIIQRAFRQHVLRNAVHKRIKLLLMAHDCAAVVTKRNAVITIQRAYRTYLNHKIDLLVKRLTGMQTAIRGKLARRRYAEERERVILLQRRWREIREQQFQARIGLAREAMIPLQAIARGVLVRKRIAEIKIAVGFVETRRRSLLSMRSAQLQFLETRLAAFTIQRAFRRYTETRADRGQYLKTVSAARMIQRTTRGHLTRLHTTTLRNSAIKIQRAWRSHRSTRQTRQTYLTFLSTIIFLQRRRRETILARSDRAQYLHLKHAVGIIESIIIIRRTTRNAAITIQRAWRSRIFLIRFRLFRQKVILLQSIWRGIQTRRNVPPRVGIIRKHLIKLVATPVNPANTLLGKTEKAVETLRTNKIAFPRAVGHLEGYVTNARGCAKVVAGDKDALRVMLDWLDTTAGALAGVSTIPLVTQRTVTAVLGVLGVIARVANEDLIKVLTTPAKGKQQGKDVGVVLLGLVEAVKGGVAGSPMGEVLVRGLKVLVRVTAGDEKKFKGRKKWDEKLKAVVEEVGKAKEGRRGKTGPGEKEKIELCAILKERFLG